MVTGCTLAHNNKAQHMRNGILFLKVNVEKPSPTECVSLPPCAPLPYFPIVRDLKDCRVWSATWERKTTNIRFLDIGLRGKKECWINSLCYNWKLYTKQDKYIILKNGEKKKDCKATKLGAKKKKKKKINGNLWSCMFVPLQGNTHKQRTSVDQRALWRFEAFLAVQNQSWPWLLSTQTRFSIGNLSADCLIIHQQHAL